MPRRLAVQQLLEFVQAFDELHWKPGNGKKGGNSLLWGETSFGDIGIGGLLNWPTVADKIPEFVLFLLMISEKNDFSFFSSGFKV